MKKYRQVKKNILQINMLEIKIKIEEPEYF